MVRRLILAAFIVIASISASVAKELPSGGETKWEIQELEVFITFLLFDPKDSAIALPKGLRFISASEVAAQAPEFEEYLKLHPEHSDWAFSFVEFGLPKTWILDGKSPKFPVNGGIGVWFAPVDHSQLAAEVPKDRYDSVLAPSPDAVLVLGLWVPDREFVDYMRARGHHADYGLVTVVKGTSGTFVGEIKLANLSVKGSVTPQGVATVQLEPFTQVFFEPGASVKKVVILAGENARERGCVAEWSKTGNHPISRGVFVGPTFQNIEGPLNGSAYRIAEEKKQ
jgi:hypothetical protein